MQPFARPKFWVTPFALCRPHNVAASKLAADGDILCDTLVFGDDKAARAIAVGLANDAGLRGFSMPTPLVNSVAAEALTSIQIFINKNYGIDAGGNG